MSFITSLCFDHNRVFSTGFSFGGMMSNAVACSGLARAVAPMAGNSSVAGCEDGECTTYEGCTEGYPVTWCEYNGDHMVAPNSGQTIWDFFAQF